MKIKVYIASPYTIGDKLANAKRQIKAADELLKHGFAPYVPLLNHFWDEISPKTESEWLDLDFEYLPICDCLLRLEGESKGADKECLKAWGLNIPIFHSVNEIINFYK